MLRRILLVLPLLSLCIKSYSQDIEKGYISVGIGVSLPDAVFGAKHLSTKYSGFANPGINYNLTYLYKFTGKWGFTAMVGRQINSVDEKALLDEYSKMNPMYNYVTTTNWSNAYLLVGVTYSIPLNLPDENKFLEFRIMAGPAYATSASYTLNDTLTIKSSNALAARFLLGAGYKFLLEKHMLISINADMALMEPNFENILVYLGNTPVGVATSIKQPMSTVSIMLNYGYSF